MEDTIETAKAVLAIILALAAFALFVAMGGDGPDIEAHAQWMAEAKEQGAWVMW